MAITATYKTPSAEYKNAYIRIQRIWGSKEEGWNAWVGVFAKEGDKEVKELFSVGVPYVENENPFTALYDKVGALSFIIQNVAEPAMLPILEPTFDPIHRTAEELKQAVKSVMDDKQKTTKKKKVAK